MRKQGEGLLAGNVVDVAAMLQVAAQFAALGNQEIQRMRAVERVAPFVVLPLVFLGGDGIAEIAVGQAGDFYFPVRAGGQGIGNGIAQAIAAFQGDFPGQRHDDQLVDPYDLEQGLMGEAFCG